MAGPGWRARSRTSEPWISIDASAGESSRGATPRKVSSITLVPWAATSSSIGPRVTTRPWSRMTTDAAKLLDLGQVVGGVDHGRALGGDERDELQQRGASADIGARGRLVEQDERRTVEPGRSRCAGGGARRPTARPRRRSSRSVRTRAFGYLIDCFPEPLAAQPGQLGEEAQVLSTRQRGVHARLLGGDPQELPSRAGIAVRVEPPRRAPCLRRGAPGPRRSIPAWSCRRRSVPAGRRSAPSATSGRPGRAPAAAVGLGDVPTPPASADVCTIYPLLPVSRSDERYVSVSKIRYTYPNVKGNVGDNASGDDRPQRVPDGDPRRKVDSRSAGEHGPARRWSAPPASSSPARASRERHSTRSRRPPGTPAAPSTSTSKARRICCSRCTTWSTSRRSSGSPACSRAATPGSWIHRPSSRRGARSSPTTPTCGHSTSSSSSTCCAIPRCESARWPIGATTVTWWWRSCAAHSKDADFKVPPETLTSILLITSDAFSNAAQLDPDAADLYRVFLELFLPTAIDDQGRPSD